MEDFVVPTVCGILWLSTWIIGYGLYRAGSKVSQEMVVSPKGWPLSNTAAFFLEFLSITAAMAAYLIVKQSHDSIALANFDAVIALNITVYALLLVFLMVYFYEMYRYTKLKRTKLMATGLVIWAYVLCQLALVIVYGTYDESVALALSLLVLLQKSGDLFWLWKRRASL